MDAKFVEQSKKDGLFGFLWAGPVDEWVAMEQSQSLTDEPLLEMEDLFPNQQNKVWAEGNRFKLAKLNDNVEIVSLAEAKKKGISIAPIDLDN